MTAMVPPQRRYRVSGQFRFVSVYFNNGDVRKHAQETVATISPHQEVPLTLAAVHSGKKSIRRVVMLAIAAGVVLPALLIGPFIAIDSFETDENERIHALMGQYGTTLGAALAQPLWLADTGAAEPLVQAVLTNRDVVAVEVDDAELGKFITLSKPTSAADNLKQQSFPILKDAVQIGTVSVSMTTRHVRADLLRQIGKLAIALGLQIVLTLVILFVVFERRMVRPVRALLSSLGNMTRGELTTRVPATGHDDELGALASGLDGMRAQLAHTLHEVTTLNAVLEQRVQERTHALQSAMDSLKSAQTEIERSERMAALGAMVAGISHELNTPIGNSLTLASTLVELSTKFQECAETSLTRKALREYTASTGEGAALLVHNLERAAQLIGSFKQVAVDRTAAHRRAFQLDTALQEILATLVAVMRRNGHVIEAELEPGIEMDSYPGQLGQVLTNIVTNADVHGLEGRSDGIIRVRAKSLGADEVELQISDNGKGIAPEHVRRIFDPFFTTKLGKGGSGLGLNIVHNLVCDVMGGRIRVESSPGHGATFFITLPRKAPLAPDAP